MGVGIRVGTSESVRDSKLGVRVSEGMGSNFDFAIGIALWMGVVDSESRSSACGVES